jgi:hypothetical protein
MEKDIKNLQNDAKDLSGLTLVEKIAMQDS